MTSGPTILNVDDYGPGRYSRSRILRQAGFAVLEAATGGDALRLVREEKPQLVVLDVNLPDMSGFEVCRTIKENPATASTLVLHLSATSVGLSSKLTGLASGGDSFLAEPVEPAELVANIHALLRLKRAEEALRQSNLTLRTLVLASPLAIVAADPAGRVIIWNPAAERLFGWAEPDVVGHRLPAEPSDGRAGVDTALEELLNAGRGFTGFETTIRRKDGEVVDVSVSTAPLRDERGVVSGSLAIVEQIGERRQSQRELARRYGEAQEASRAKDEFLATLSHELRTPLNAMLGWIRMLRQGAVPQDQVTHALEIVERNAVAQARLIEDILDVSRIISGKLLLQLEPVDVVEIARAAVSAEQPLAAARSQTFDVSLPSVPIVVDGDFHRLQQVILNLLSNAIKFTPRGARIGLEVSATDREARVTVCDEGVGIRPEFLPHVFERFRQADSTSSRPHTGLGLGLAIVRHLVEAHGGTVSAASAGFERGSTFTVVIPRLAVAAAGLRPHGAPRELRLDNVNVLVVDDEADSRELLVALLGGRGAIVRAAASVPEAMQALAGSPPDVVIADLGMPDRDGYALLREIRALAPNPVSTVPTIAVTGYASAHDRGQVRAAGFCEHLAKPVDPDTLVAAIVASLWQ